MSSSFRIGAEGPLSGSGPEPAEIRWWVIHTLPRCEKKMDSWLMAREWGHFLPTRPRRRSYPGKTVTFQHPLFPCYAFGSFSLLQRNAVYGSGYAAAVLPVANQTQLLLELDNIRLALGAGPDAAECPFLAIGQRARVTAGKLKGLEGIVCRARNKTRMILSVEMLQRAVSVEIDPDWLEPLA